MRTTILTLGLGLLLAAPAFAARSNHQRRPAATATTGSKGAIAQGAPAGEAKPAPAAKPEAGKKAVKSSRHKKSEKSEKTEGAKAPAEGMAK